MRRSPVLAAMDTRKIANGKHLLGIWTQGFDPDTTARFEHWLGRKVDYALVFGGQDRGWSDFVGSVGMIHSVWARTGRKLLWSQPIIARQSNEANPMIANLNSAAKGAYDNYWQQVIDYIGGQDPNAVVRLGWEFNGTWYPWGVTDQQRGPGPGHADTKNYLDYIGAFRHFVQLAHRKYPHFSFLWCPNLGQPGSDPVRAYPGDDVVDIIGMDVYENSQFIKGSPDQRWHDILMKDGRGLEWIASFASQHNKPLTIPEWGSNIDDGTFIAHMHDWMLTHNVMMNSYWNSDDAFASALATHPTNGMVYKKLFQKW